MSDMKKRRKVSLIAVIPPMMNVARVGNVPFHELISRWTRTALSVNFTSTRCLYFAATHMGSTVKQCKFPVVALP